MNIAIATQKGGTGKTTTSISLASGLARLKKKKILLVDLDSQANASKVLLHEYMNIPSEKTILRTILRRESIPIYETNIEGLSVSPSHILMSQTDMDLAMAKDHREARLKNELEKIQGNYDHIIIDCPPSLGWLTINAFTAAHGVIIVASPGYFELDSIGQIRNSLNEVKEFFNHDLSLIGILFNQSDPTVNSKTSLQLLRQAYTGQVFKTVIPKNTDMRDAHFNKMDIFSHKPEATSALAFKKLLDEIKL